MIEGNAKPAAEEIKRGLPPAIAVRQQNGAAKQRR
jgi:hypothetical protein